MIKHVYGDIFESNEDAILHQVNCQGVMGSGVAKQVKAKFPGVFERYKAFCQEDKDRRNCLIKSTSSLLGHIQICLKDDYPRDKQKIVNLFAQDRFGYGKCYTDYDALKQCLIAVNKEFKGKSVALPYLMSCGRAGGDWNIVYDLIKTTLTDCDVTLYEYQKGESN